MKKTVVLMRGVTYGHISVYTVPEGAESGKALADWFDINKKYATQYSELVQVDFPEIPVDDMVIEALKGVEAAKKLAAEEYFEKLSELSKAESAFRQLTLQGMPKAVEDPQILDGEITEVSNDDTPF
jgi:hypothetical protein